MKDELNKLRKLNAKYSLDAGSDYLSEGRRQEIAKMEESTQKNDA